MYIDIYIHPYIYINIYTLYINIYIYILYINIYIYNIYILNAQVVLSVATNRLK